MTIDDSNPSLSEVLSILELASGGGHVNSIQGAQYAKSNLLPAIDAAHTIINATRKASQLALLSDEGRKKFHERVEQQQQILTQWTAALELLQDWPK